MERTIVCFENEYKDCKYNAQVLQEIRQRDPDAFVVMISAGIFTAAGDVIEPSCHIRSIEYRTHGADLILSLPVASELGGYGQKEFAQAALVQRLRIPERIIIPCTPAVDQSLKDCGDALRSYAMFMLQEPGGFRARLKGYLDQNLPFREAQVQTICDEFEHAEEVLSYTENRMALWTLFAFLQLYYMAHVEFVPAPGRDTAPGRGSMDAAMTDRHSTDKDVYADTGMDLSMAEEVTVTQIKELLTVRTEEELVDISGSTPQMAGTLIQKEADIQGFYSLDEITELLLPGSRERIRLFLLKAILGVKKIYMQICGLHEYVPYCIIAAENPQKATQIREMSEKTWVPFAGDYDPARKLREKYHYLMQIDEKAEELYD